MKGDYPEQGAVLLPDGKYAYKQHIVNFDEIGVFLDQIEPLLTLLNSYVDDLESISTTINGNVDNLETIATAISNAATAINNNVDTLESLNAAIRDYVKTPTTIIRISKTVVTPGTQVPLFETSTPCKKVVLFAKNTNTNEVFMSNGDVDKDVDFGYEARESQEFEIDDASKIFIDATVGGEGVVGFAVV